MNHVCVSNSVKLIGQKHHSSCTPFKTDCIELILRTNDRQFRHSARRTYLRTHRTSTPDGLECKGVFENQSQSASPSQAALFAYLVPNRYRFFFAFPGTFTFRIDIHGIRLSFQVLFFFIFTHRVALGCLSLYVDHNCRFLRS